MRTVAGEVVLPIDAPRGEAHTVLIEVRDVSVADAPSIVLASTRLRHAHVGPGGRLPFSMQVPEATPGRRLAIRVHVDVRGTGHVAEGDFLTAVSIGVPVTGAKAAITIPVKKV